MWGLEAMREMFLVARREYLAYLTSWGFWVSLLTTPLIMGVFAIVPTLLRNAEPARAITIVAEDRADLDAARAGFAEHERGRIRAALRASALGAPDNVLKTALEAFDDADDADAAIAAATQVLQEAGAAGSSFSKPAPAYLFVDPPARTPAELTPWLNKQRQVDIDGKEMPLFGALFITRTAEGAAEINYWSENLTDNEPMNLARDGIQEQLRQDALVARGLSGETLRQIEKLKPTATQYRPGAETAVSLQDRAPALVGLVLSVFLLMSVFSVVNLLLTGVIEEKGAKILDTLLTSVAPWHLLAGKLLGVAAVSFSMFAVWGVMGGLIFVNTAGEAQGFIAAAGRALTDPGLLAIFGVSFVLGYVLYGSLFLAVGSLCETLNESQTLISPMMLLLMAPLLLIGPAIQNPETPVILGASWIPLFTPFLLLIRAGAGNLTFLEAALPLALTAVTAGLVLWGAGRVFKAGASGQLSINDVKRLMGGKKAKAPALADGAA